MIKKQPLALFLICLLVSIDVFSQSDVFAIARTGTVENLKELMTSNPEIINTVNNDGNSPLIIACYKGNYEVANYLIKQVKDVNYASKMGTALMAATVKNDLPIVKLLLENRANPNIADANGTTALHYAANFKFYDIATMLIQYKANVELEDSRKKTPFDYAVIANDDKLIQILKTK